MRVTDTGIGITCDIQDVIVDAFVQVHRDLTRTTDGTGLGLTISRDLARKMGGDLRVRSVRGVGSSFRSDAVASVAARPAPRAPQPRTA